MILIFMLKVCPGLSRTRATSSVRRDAAKEWLLSLKQQPAQKEVIATQASLEYPDDVKQQFAEKIKREWHLLRSARPPGGIVATKSARFSTQRRTAEHVEPPAAPEKVVVTIRLPALRLARQHS